MTVLIAIVTGDVGEVLKHGLSIMQKILDWNLDLIILTLVRMMIVNGSRTRHNLKYLTII
jgi:hypothetical protein